MMQQIEHFVMLIIIIGFILKFLGLTIGTVNRHFKSKNPVIPNTFDDCDKPYAILGEMEDGPVTSSDSMKDAFFCLFATIVSLIILAPIISCIISMLKNVY